MRKFKILGICGGNGVNLYPFLNTKHEILGNMEPRRVFKDPKNAQWKANFKNIPIDHTGFLRTWGNGPDIIIGAPDCGHSSILGLSRKKKMGNPKENKSLSFYINAVETFLPSVFVMENLPALLGTYGIDDLRKAFIGYNLEFFCESVASWGNSQVSRVRLIIVGVRKDLDWLKYFILPKKEYAASLLKHSGELTKGLEKEDITLGNLREPIDTEITLYARKKLSARKIQKGWMHKHKGKKRWPVENRNFTSAPGVYRNLKNDYPATARKASRQYNHLGLMMTPRELARIQGIPDDYKIYMEPDNYRYWINKGRITVTKTAPYEIGTWIIKCLKRIP